MHDLQLSFTSFVDTSVGLQWGSVSMLVVTPPVYTYICEGTGEVCCAVIPYLGLTQISETGQLVNLCTIYLPLLCSDHQIQYAVFFLFLCFFFVILYFVTLISEAGWLSQPCMAPVLYTNLHLNSLCILLDTCGCLNTVVAGSGNSSIHAVQHGWGIDYFSLIQSAG